ncbi:MAG: ATP-binding cassette domain-containing protein [Bradyrhizobiaceae bacterium]|nr:ATP-binding cassette domain-containing protein [Bradyrhizobiaceae bacterium]
MTEPLLRLDQICKRFGGFVALSDVTMSVARGERLGLIGPNGSGKTTLINCVSGVLPADSGRVVLDGHDISSLPPYRRARAGLARSFQIPLPFSSMTVLENLMVPLEYVDHGILDLAKRSEVQAEAIEILEGVRLSDKAQVPANRLSQVDLRKLELARAIAARPRLLVSDEAMAGLATQEVSEICQVDSAGAPRDGIYHAPISSTSLLRKAMNKGCAKSRGRGISTAKSPTMVAGLSLSTTIRSAR